MSHRWIYCLKWMSWSNMFYNLPDKRQIIAVPFSQKWLVIYSMLFAHIHCLENTWTEISAFQKRTGSPGPDVH